MTCQHNFFLIKKKTDKWVNFGIKIFNSWLLHVLVQREMWGTTVTSEVKGVTLDGGDWSWEPMKLPICCLLVIYLSLFRYNLSLSGFLSLLVCLERTKTWRESRGEQQVQKPFFIFWKKTSKTTTMK